MDYLAPEDEEDKSEHQGESAPDVEIYRNEFGESDEDIDYFTVDDFPD